MKHKMRVASCLAAIGLASVANAQYTNLTTIQDLISELAATSGGAATNLVLTDSTNGVIQTVGIDPVDPSQDIARRNIWLLKIAKTNAVANPTKVLVTGTQHAREWVSYRTVLDAAQFILDHKNSNTWDSSDARFDHFRQFKEMTVSNLTTSAQIFMVPIVNPEGYQWSKTNDSFPQTSVGWRKNRRDTSGDTQAGDLGPHNPPGGITPGVDLNRSYPSYDWGMVGMRQWKTGTEQISTSRYKDEDTYCGLPTTNTWGSTNAVHTPVLEKETQGIVTLSSSNTFACHIDVHSWSALIGWAENATTNNANLRAQSGLTDDKVFAQIAQKAADLIIDPNTSTAYEADVGPYPTSGDILKWQYQNTSSNCLALLIEIGKAADYRPTNATAHAERVLPGMLFMMFSAVDDSFASEPYATFRKPGSPPPP